MSYGIRAIESAIKDALKTKDIVKQSSHPCNIDDELIKIDYAIKELKKDLLYIKTIRRSKPFINADQAQTMYDLFKTKDINEIASIFRVSKHIADTRIKQYQECAKKYKKQ